MRVPDNKRQQKQDRRPHNKPSHLEALSYDHVAKTTVSVLPHHAEAKTKTAIRSKPEKACGTQKIGQHQLPGRFANPLMAASTMMIFHGVPTSSCLSEPLTGRPITANLIGKRRIQSPTTSASTDSNRKVVNQTLGKARDPPPRRVEQPFDQSRFFRSAVRRRPLVTNQGRVDLRGADLLWGLFQRCRIGLARLPQCSTHVRQVSHRHGTYPT